MGWPFLMSCSRAASKPAKSITCWPLCMFLLSDRHPVSGVIHEYRQVMYVVMPYCVLMEAMLSCLIHGGNISRISPFQFRGLVGMGEMGHVGPHLC